MAAVPLEHGAEVAQGLFLATLDDRNETSRVLLFDLLVLAAFAAQAAAFDEQAGLPRQSDDERDDDSQPQAGDQRDPDGQGHVAPQEDRLLEDLPVGVQHRCQQEQPAEQQDEQQESANLHRRLPSKSSKQHKIQG